MAKFRKRIKIAPGVNINLSKSGVSGTFGGKGASVNVGKNGVYANTGIPGTGIYDRQKISGGGSGAEGADSVEYETGEPEGAKIGAVATFGGVLVLLGLIFIIGYFAAGSFWLKKVIAAAVFVFGIFLCIKGGAKSPPKQDQPAEAE
jgi:hypothetical protein